MWVLDHPILLSQVGHLQGKGGEPYSPLPHAAVLHHLLITVRASFHCYHPGQVDGAQENV